MCLPLSMVNGMPYHSHRCAQYQNRIHQLGYPGRDGGSWSSVQEDRMNTKGNLRTTLQPRRRGSFDRPFHHRGTASLSFQALYRWEYLPRSGGSHSEAQCFRKHCHHTGSRSLTRAILPRPRGKR